jgi:hypothetical protein
MVYPNPSKDKLFVVFKQDAEVHLTVRDLAGRLLLEHDCGFSKSKSELQLNISGFPKGVYLLQLKESSGKEHSIRFAKE